MKFRSIATVNAGASVETRVAIARAATEIAILANETWGAGAMMRAFLVPADATILTRIALAEISFGFTISTHPSRFAHTIVAVFQLNTFLHTKGRAGIGKTLVDISFASWANKSWTTLTVIAAYFVNASSTMVAGSLKALID